jgi:hypothetical protein
MHKQLSLRMSLPTSEIDTIKKRTFPKLCSCFNRRHVIALIRYNKVIPTPENTLLSQASLNKLLVTPGYFNKRNAIKKTTLLLQHLQVKENRTLLSKTPKILKIILKGIKSKVVDVKKLYLMMLSKISVLNQPETDPIQSCLLSNLSSDNSDIVTVSVKNILRLVAYEEDSKIEKKRIWPNLLITFFREHPRLLLKISLVFSHSTLNQDYLDDRSLDVASELLINRKPILQRSTPVHTLTNIVKGLTAEHAYTKEIATKTLLKLSTISRGYLNNEFNRYIIKFSDILDTLLDSIQLCRNRSSKIGLIHNLARNSDNHKTLLSNDKLVPTLIKGLDIRETENTTTSTDDYAPITEVLSYDFHNTCANTIILFLKNPANVQTFKRKYVPKIEKVFGIISKPKTMNDQKFISINTTFCNLFDEIRSTCDKVHHVHVSLDKYNHPTGDLAIRRFSRSQG